MLGLELFAAAASGTPPSGPPISVSRSFYQTSKIQIDVVLGDHAAFTRIYVDDVLYATLAPGVDSLATGETSLGSIEASHIRNGIETARIAEA